MKKSNLEFHQTFDNVNDVMRKCNLSFNHSQIAKLFATPYYIPSSDDIIDILTLTRETAIEDFENIIKLTFKCECNPINDGVNRNIVDISLIFLYYFRSKESLPILLDYLRQDLDYMYIWQNSSAIENYTWPIFAYCALYNPKQFVDLALESDIYLWNRTEAAIALAKVAITHPEEYDKMVCYYKELLMKYYLKRNDLSVYDPEFIGVVEKYIVEMGAEELINDLEVFHNDGIVDEDYMGEFPKVVEKIKSTKTSPKTMMPKSIVETMKSFNRIAFTVEDEEDDLLWDLFDLYGIAVPEDDEDIENCDDNGDVECCDSEADCKTIMDNDYSFLEDELNVNNINNVKNNNDQLWMCNDIGSTHYSFDDSYGKFSVRDDGSWMYNKKYDKKNKFNKKNKKNNNYTDEYEKSQEDYLRKEYYSEFDLNDYL